MLKDKKHIRDIMELGRLHDDLQKHSRLKHKRVISGSVTMLTEALSLRCYNAVSVS